MCTDDTRCIRPHQEKRSPLKITTLIMTLLLASPLTSLAAVTVSSGGHIRLLDILAFNERITIVTTFPLPPMPTKYALPAETIACDVPTSPACNIRNLTATLLETVHRFVDTIPGTPGQTHLKAIQKRSIASTILSALGGLVTNGFPKIWSFLTDPSQKAVPSGHEEPSLTVAIKDQPTKFSKKIINTFKDVLRKTSWFGNETDSEGHGPFLALILETSRAFADVEEALITYVQFAVYENALQSCSDKKIPRSLFSDKVLEAVLVKAKEKLASTEARFAIPESNREAYFHLTAAECFHAPGEFQVHMKIPVIQGDSQTFVYEISPLPFRVDEAICYNFNEPFKLASSKTSTIILDHDHEPVKGVIDLPRDTGIEKLNPCLSPLFPDKVFGVTPCKPKCVTGPETDIPVLMQVSHNSFFVVTSPKFPLEIHCDGQINHVDHINLGILLIEEFPSHCAVLSNGVELFQRNHLLNDSATARSIRSTQVVPFQWTASDTLLTFERFLKGRYSVQNNQVRPISEVRNIVGMDEVLPDFSSGEQALLYSGPTALGAGVLACLSGAITWFLRRWRKRSSQRNPREPWYRGQDSHQPATKAAVQISAPLNPLAPIAPNSTSFVDPVNHRKAASYLQNQSEPLLGRAQVVDVQLNTVGSPRRGEGRNPQRAVSAYFPMNPPPPPPPEDSLPLRRQQSQPLPPPPPPFPLIDPNEQRCF